MVRNQRVQYKVHYGKIQLHQEQHFYAILDELGYYIVPGTSVILAQARGLGFSVICAGQDFQAFANGANKDEANSIKANCTLQICMKLQDEEETYQIFAKKSRTR